MEDGGNGTGMEGFVGGVTDKGPSQQLTGGADRGFDYRGGPGRGGPDSRRGFRGTAENSKTKLCMRYVLLLGCVRLFDSEHNTALLLAFLKVS